MLAICALLHIILSLILLLLLLLLAAAAVAEAVVVVVFKLLFLTKIYVIAFLWLEYLTYYRPTN